MKSLYEKEKKLNEAIEKLNLVKPEDINLKNTFINLDEQKNQLEIELLSNKRTKFFNFKCPARLKASWLIPSIRHPSPAKT